jgi:hypothetical protein
LNRPQTEESRRSIEPAFLGVTAKLQFFPLLTDKQLMARKKIPNGPPRRRNPSVSPERGIELLVQKYHAANRPILSMIQFPAEELILNSAPARELKASLVPGTTTLRSPARRDDFFLIEQSVIADEQ